MALSLSASSADEPERGTLRVGYGVANRHGGQTDSGPGLSYEGYSPNNVYLEGWYFPKWYGFAAEVERESYALLDSSGRVTGGTLYRGNIGPAFRIRFGPARVELTAGYSLATLPLYNNSIDVIQKRAQRQAVMVGGRAVLDWPWRDAVEIRGDYPIAFDVRTSDGAIGGRAPGFTAGAGIRAPLYTGDAFQFGLLLNWRFAEDKVFTSDGRISSQYLNRFGLAADFSFGDRKPPPPITTGTLIVRATLIGGAPLPADATLKLAEYPDLVVARRADGAWEARHVPQGTVTVQVASPGYVAQEGQVSVLAGGEVPLAVALEKEPPKSGNLRIVALERGKEKPVRTAIIRIGEESRPVEPDGTLSWPDLPIGAVGVTVTAPGYQADTEAANVQGGQTTELKVLMLRLEVKLPATVSGFVRNTQDGTPVAATLQIPALKQKLEADEQGTFTTQLKGGTYRVIISAPGFVTQTKGFTVKDGDQAIFNVDLYPSRVKHGKSRGKR